jgi:hypothetical protein
VICTWAGLEKRVVELTPQTDGLAEILHPAELLEHWFPGTHVKSDGKQSDAFFSHLAVVNSDYGLGDSFWRNLDYGLQDQRCYSRLVTASDWRHGGRTTFRFGVLHLRRLNEDRTFEVV